MLALSLILYKYLEKLWMGTFSVIENKWWEIAERAYDVRQWNSARIWRIYKNKNLINS